MKIKCLNNDHMLGNCSNVKMLSKMFKYLLISILTVMNHEQTDHGSIPILDHVLRSTETGRVRVNKC